MHRRSFHIPLILLGAMIWACASSADLTRDGQQAFTAGEYALAVTKALDALDKDQTNEAARQLLRDAAPLYFAEKQTSIFADAETDILQAADRLLKLAAELARITAEHVTVETGDDYPRRAAELRRSAATTLVANADRHTAAGEYKPAYRELMKATRYKADLPGFKAKLAAARDRAVHRIVFLPWRNETEHPGLSRRILDAYQQEFRRNPKRLTGEFVEVVPFDRIWEVLPVAKIETLEMADAEKYTREIGGNTIIVGVLEHLELRESDYIHNEILYQRIEYEDAQGRVVDRRYQQAPLPVHRKERAVTFRYTFEIIDLHNRRVLDRHQDVLTFSDAIHTTTIEITGNPEEDYTLYDPAIPDPGGNMRRQLQRDWQQRYPDITLTRLLTVFRAQWDRRYNQTSPWASVDTRRDETLDTVPDLILGAMRTAWDPLTRAIRRLNND